MYVQQTHSVLFFPKRNKARIETGKVPIYARLVIDGKSLDRAVKGVLILPGHWDVDTKTVKPADPKAKSHNKKLANLYPYEQVHLAELGGVLVSSIISDTAFFSNCVYQFYSDCLCSYKTSRA